jgi:hypothetical protein
MITKVVRLNCEWDQIGQNFAAPASGAFVILRIQPVDRDDAE